MLETITLLPFSTEVAFRNSAGTYVGGFFHNEEKGAAKVSSDNPFLWVASCQAFSQLCSNQCPRSKYVLGHGQNLWRRSGYSIAAIAGDKKSWPNIDSETSANLPWHLPWATSASNTAAPRLPPETPLIAKM